MFDVPLKYRITDRVKGEIVQNFQVLPKVTTQLSKKELLFKDNKPKETKTQSSGTPWWIARNRDLIGRQPTFRSDVAMKRFRNPSARANFTNIMSEYEYLVDYLIAEGHADTVEEATYVLQQMGEEAAVEILNEIV